MPLLAHQQTTLQWHTLENQWLITLLRKHLANLDKHRLAQYQIMHPNDHHALFYSALPNVKKAPWSFLQPIHWQDKAYTHQKPSQYLRLTHAAQPLNALDLIRLLRHPP